MDKLADSLSIHADNWQIIIIDFMSCIVTFFSDMVQKTFVLFEASTAS